MTVAEKKAKKAYKENLISQGIDKDLAEIMAKTFVDYEIVKPVSKWELLIKQKQGAERPLC